MSPWIKIGHDTCRKVEVLRIARRLGVSRHAAFGMLVEFWIWLDGVSVDGRVDGVVDADVDAVVAVDGFASALREVGWLDSTTEGDVLVPNFDRHNGKSAKARSLKTDRQRRFRTDVDASVDAVVDAQATQERLRERHASVASSSSSSSSCIESLRSKDKEASEAKPTAPRKAASYPADFERFWDAYHIRRAGKADALKAWKKLSDETREKAIAAAKVYSDTKRDTGCPYICHPATWLNEGRFDDDPETWMSETARRQLTIKRKLEAFAAEEAAEQQSKGVVNGYR